MIETKFILLFLFWIPSPASDSLPFWTNQEHADRASCEAAAREMTQRVQKEHGRDVRTQYHCLSMEDYTGPDGIPRL